MSTPSSRRCSQCHTGELRPARLLIGLTYDGQLMCEARGDELIGERATAFLLTHRALAPHAEMSVIVSRTTESV